MAVESRSREGDRFVTDIGTAWFAPKCRRSRSHETTPARVLSTMPSRTRSERPTPLPPFERVLEQHGRAVLRFCVTEAGAARAEDCFQETMLAALQAYDELRDAGAVRAWLLAIAARKVVDQHRSTRRAPEPVADVDAHAAPDDEPAHDAALWARVARLPDKQRRAVTLRYGGDLSHREIALVMATSEAAARRNVFEGLARLRKDIAGG
jgi:RNA polymerase sigma factor (sigma-70 family)